MSHLKLFFKLTLIIAVNLTQAGHAFELASADVQRGGKIGEDFVFAGMGCNGKNISPELHWKGAPKDAKSFALTIYDPDAPTGSGFWHWIIVNIPATTTSLARGWKSEGTGATEVTNDFGTTQYGGPCPPPGKPHHYKFTLHALKVDKLDIAPGTTNAVARFMINGQTEHEASFTATYQK